MHSCTHATYCINMQSFANSTKSSAHPESQTIVLIKRVPVYSDNARYNIIVSVVLYSTGNDEEGQLPRLCLTQSAARWLRPEAVSCCHSRFYWHRQLRQGMVRNIIPWHIISCNIRGNLSGATSWKRTHRQYTLLPTNQGKPCMISVQALVKQEGRLAHL